MLVTGKLRKLIWLSLAAVVLYLTFHLGAAYGPKAEAQGVAVARPVWVSIPDKAMLGYPTLYRVLCIVVEKGDSVSVSCKF